MMKQSNAYWDKRCIDRFNTSEKYTTQYINRIKKIYERAYQNVEDEIQNVYKNYAKDTGLDIQELKTLLSKKETDTFWKTLQGKGLSQYVKNNYKSRISRLEKIQAQIYAKAKEIYKEEELEQNMCYKGVINDDYYRTIYDVQKGTGYSFNFSNIDDNLIDSLLNERWSGSNYSDRIWENTDILGNSISEIIGGALMSGQDIEKTSRQVRERFDIAKNVSDRLVRTEMTYFNNQADAMAYKEMNIDTYVFTSTLDIKTCDECGEHDEKKYNYEDMEVGVNFPPIHPNCRCTTHGYLGEDEEKNLQRRARNPITGKNEVVDNISYKEWKKQNINKLGSGKNSDLYVKPHKQMQYLEKIDNLNDGKAINILEKYEKSIIDSDIENAIMILDDGRVFQSYGVSDEVYPYYDLLKSSTTKNNHIVYMTHNHPKKETNYSFDGTDRNLFSNQTGLKVLRGEDYKYKYMFSRLNSEVDWIDYNDNVNEINFENVQHTYNIEYAIKNKISYKRWRKDVIAKTNRSQKIR